MANQIQSCFQRYEKKYRLTRAQQEFLLHAMRPYLEADRYGQYTICNIYYDTDDWHLIRTSLEKPVYKEKLRVRSYGVPGDNDPVFVELKKKYDGVVYKRRITTEAHTAAQLLAGQIPGSTFGQIGREIGWFQSVHQTAPKAFIGYDRLAFAGIENSDLRITFDTNLRWRTTETDLRQGSHGALILPEDEVLMEIKIPGAAPLWLSHLLTEADAFSSSFSKYGYCFQHHIAPNLNRKKALSCA